MEIKLITGLSGAGKSTLINYFEQEGYQCHDNFPAFLIENYINSKEINKIAFCCDTRGEKEFRTLINEIDNLKSKNIDFNVIYLDSKESILIKRFKEKKLLHHFQLKGKKTLIEAVKYERELIEVLKPYADYILDTSNLSEEDLILKAKQIFGDEQNEVNKLMITCQSFGYKHGFPENADVLFDVRCFKNPYWVPELKEMTGLDKEVQDYIFSFEDSNKFMEKVYDMIDFIIPMYIKEGKRNLIISFGCTGGKHRSVCFAQKLYEYLSKKSYNVGVMHKNIKNKKRPI